LPPLMAKMPKDAENTASSACITQPMQCRAPLPGLLARFAPWLCAYRRPGYISEFGRILFSERRCGSASSITIGDESTLLHASFANAAVFAGAESPLSWPVPFSFFPVASAQRLGLGG